MASSRQRPRSTRLLVVVLVSISLAIITLDYRQGEQGPLEVFGRTAAAAMAPLQEAVTAVTRPIGHFFVGLAHLPSLESENLRLKQQVADYQAGQAAIPSTLRQLQALQQLLKLRGTFTSRTVAATVIANGVSNFQYTATIDRGSTSGIAVDMPVVTGGPDGARLVGKVVSVTPDASVVELAIDRDFSVAGELVTNAATGLIQGQGEGDMKGNLFAVGTEVQAGDAVVTKSYLVNGQTGLYPPGIVIGTVSRTFAAPNALESFVTVRPAVDFSNLDYVMVIETTNGG